MKPNNELIEEMESRGFIFLYNVHPSWLAEDISNSREYFAGQNGSPINPLSVDEIKKKIAKEFSIEEDDVSAIPKQYESRHFPGRSYSQTKYLVAIFLKESIAKKSPHYRKHLHVLESII